MFLWASPILSLITCNAIVSKASKTFKGHSASASQISAYQIGATVAAPNRSGLCFANPVSGIPCFYCEYAGGWLQVVHSALQLIQEVIALYQDHSKM